MEIPDYLRPLDSQVPPNFKEGPDRERWDLCFAITRLICRRDDPLFTRQLFASDFPTGTLALKVDQPSKP